MRCKQRCVAADVGTCTHHISLSRPRSVCLFAMHQHHPLQTHCTHLYLSMFNACSYVPHEAHQSHAKLPHLLQTLPRVLPVLQSCTAPLLHTAHSQYPTQPPATCLTALSSRQARAAMNIPKEAWGLRCRLLQAQLARHQTH